jgi:tetratricopeptide (TPR) repeat protein
MYALERSSAEDPAESAAAAQRRLCDHYISGASVAMDALYPTEKARRPQVDTSSARLLLLGTQPSARAWLNSNMNNLLSAIADAAIHGRPEQAELLDATIASHLFSTGQFHNGMTAHSHAVNAARERGDRASEARALHNLANCLHRLGHLDEAFALLRQALELRWEVSDRKGEGHTLGLLGNVAWQAGRPEEAAQRFEEALAIAREVGDLLSESITLGNLGVVHDRLGDFRKALDYFEQSLAIARSFDDRSRVSYALANIGAVLGVLDRHAEAVQHLTEALAIDREFGNRLHESSSLGNLGIAHLRLGKPVEALTYLEQSVIIDREIGDLASECTTTSALATAQAYLGDVEQSLENHRRADQACDRLDQPNMKAEAYNYHGETLWVLGRPAEALKHHDAALVQALRIDSLYQQARAVEGAARALYSLGGRDAEALEQQQRALALYAQLGIPKKARSDRSS